MSGLSVIFSNIFLLALVIAIGAVSAKTGYLPAETKGILSKIVVRITLPLLIINSLTKVELDAARIKNSVFVIICAVIAIFVLYLAGAAVSKIFHLPKMQGFIHRCMTAFGNVAFLGYPVIYALYGDNGLFYAALYTFVNDILVWTFVVQRLCVLNGAKYKSFRETIKNCLTPPTIAFIVSFFMLILGLRPGGIIGELCAGIGGTATYLSMLFIGMTLAEVRLSEIFKSYSVFLIVLIKMLIIPIIGIFIMRYLPFDNLVKGTVIMQIAVPSQTIISILVQEYGGDTKYIVKGIFITTVSGLITMPFIYYLLTLS